jgi:hypothetical protein
MLLPILGFLLLAPRAHGGSITSLCGCAVEVPVVRNAAPLDTWGFVAVRLDGRGLRVGGRPLESFDECGEAMNDERARRSELSTGDEPALLLEAEAKLPSWVVLEVLAACRQPGQPVWLLVDS